MIGQSSFLSDVKTPRILLKERATKDAFMMAEGCRLNRRVVLTVTMISVLSLAAKRSPAADDLTAQISAGLLRLSNQIEYDNVRIALFTDGSKEFSAAAAAVQSVGGSVVDIDARQDLATLREQYRRSNCFAAIVPNAELLKGVMVGEGLLCERCAARAMSVAPLVARRRSAVRRGVRGAGTAPFPGELRAGRRRSRRGGPVFFEGQTGRIVAKRTNHGETMKSPRTDRGP